MENQKPNPQPSARPVVANSNNLNNRPHPQGARFGFRPRKPVQTRTLQNDSRPAVMVGVGATGSAIVTASGTTFSGNTSPAVSNASGHRIVLGKGAQKHPEALRHIAGARMNVIRKESRPMKRSPSPARPLTFSKDTDVIPAMAPDTIRIIPLGGVEEIGRNMTAIEYNNDIIVIDIGFQFKDENTPGIDYILPNTKYLEERQDRVRAVIITHGHLDHIGGIPYIMPRIGNPPLYTRLLTSVLVQKRQEEFPHVAKLDIRVVEKNETIRIIHCSLIHCGVISFGSGIRPKII